MPLIADPRGLPRASSTASPASTPPTPAEVRETLATLVDDAGLRARVGAAARAHVREHRSIRAVAPQWARVLEEVRPERVAA